jgi:hypothetical protein
MSPSPQLRDASQGESHQLTNGDPSLCQTKPPFRSPSRKLAISPLSMVADFGHRSSPVDRCPFLMKAALATLGTP